MSFKYRIVKNKIKDSKTFGKYYGRAIILNKVTTNQLCDEISHSTTVTESDVRAVLSELRVRLHDHLINNHSVKIDGLGTFFVRMNTTPTEKMEEFSADRIKNVSVGFLPETTKATSGIMDKDGHNHKPRYKKLLEGMTFEQFKYDSTSYLETKENTSTEGIEETGE